MKTLAEINQANRAMADFHSRNVRQFVEGKARDEFKLDPAEINKRLTELQQRLKQAEALPVGTPGRAYKIETINLEISRLNS
jgi:hypothetical protein